MTPRAAKTFLFLAIGLVYIFIQSTTCSADLSKAAIEQARQDLRVSLFSYNSAVAQLDQLTNSNSASPELLELYQSYLNRLEKILVENRKMVGEMEALYTASRPAMHLDQPGYSAVENEPNQESHTLPQEHIYDELSALEGELNQSVSEFDEMLLIEDAELAAKLEAIRANSAGKLQDLAEEAHTAEEEIRAQTDSHTSSTDTVSDEDSAKKAPIEGEHSSEEVKKGGDFEKRKSQPGMGDKTERHPQGQIEYDDDIVARQLREAAEKETDPELKKKLWQEYEQYKTNSSHD
jgi:hypothetical protein